MKNLPLKKTTREDIRRYAEELLAAMRADESYEELSEGLTETGLELDISLRYTYTDNKKNAFVDSDGEDVPYGVEVQLIFDMVRGEYIQCSADPERKGLQFRVTVPFVRTPDTMFLSRLTFYSFEEVAEQNRLFEMLEEYLDDAEEYGTIDSPFRRNGLCRSTTDAPLTLFSSAKELPAGSYVEMSPFPYDGTVGGEKSVFLSEDAFLPYRLLLLSLCTQEELAAPALTLSGERAETFCSLLSELPELTRGEKTFVDILTSVGLAYLEPSPNTEKLLNFVTLSRRAAFLSVTDAVCAYLDACRTETGEYTLIW